MNDKTIIQPSSRIDAATGRLTGANVTVSYKRLKQLENVFADKKAFAEMDGEQIVYRVECHAAIDEVKPGGLFFGTSYIYPGQVGGEYFMTKGHFHAKPDTAEYYWGISGEGILLLMTQDGECTAHRVCPGSLHYIPGFTAHRLINTGSEILAVGACWGSDAGHDYGSIERSGFTARVIDRGGAPAVIGGQ